MNEKEKQYRKLLSGFDFYYEMSDDHSVWSRGREQWKVICDLAKEVDSDRKIMNEYLNAKRY